MSLNENQEVEQIEQEEVLPGYYVEQTSESLIKSGYFQYPDNSFVDPNTGSTPWYANLMFMKVMSVLFMALLVMAGINSLTFTEVDNALSSNTTLIVIGIMSAFGFYIEKVQKKEKQDGIKRSDGFLDKIAYTLLFVAPIVWFGATHSVSMDISYLYLIPIEVFSLVLLGLFFMRVNLVSKAQGENKGYIKTVIYTVAGLLIAKTIYMLLGGDKTVDAYFFIISVMPLFLQSSLLMGVAVQRDMNPFVPSMRSISDVVSIVLMGIALYLSETQVVAWIIYALYALYVVINQDSRTIFNEYLTRVLIFISLMAIGTMMAIGLGNDVIAFTEAGMLTNHLWFFGITTVVLFAAPMIGMSQGAKWAEKGMTTALKMWGQYVIGHSIVILYLAATM